MSTIFVLPSRHQVGRQFADVLASTFPGLRWAGSSWPELGELLANHTLAHADVYVVFREDLPDDDVSDATLVAACGAEPGDEIVEVMLGTTLMEAFARRRRVHDANAAA